MAAEIAPATRTDAASRIEGRAEVLARPSYIPGSKATPLGRVPRLKPQLVRRAHHGLGRHTCQCGTVV
jgi:hypothetical protein